MREVLSWRMQWTSLNCINNSLDLRCVLFLHILQNSAAPPNLKPVLHKNGESCPATKCIVTILRRDDTLIAKMKENETFMQFLYNR